MLGYLARLGKTAVKNAGFQTVQGRPNQVVVRGKAKPGGFAALFARITGGRAAAIKQQQAAAEAAVKPAPTGTLTMERKIEKRYTGNHAFFGNKQNLTKQFQEAAAQKAIAEGLLRQAYDPHHKAIRVVCADEFPTC